MAEASVHGAYLIHEGMYRVPDLLTEPQFIEYMKDTYGVEVTFNHLATAGESPTGDLGATGQQVGDTETTPKPAE